MSALLSQVEQDGIMVKVALIKSGIAAAALLINMDPPRHPWCAVVPRSQHEEIAASVQAGRHLRADWNVLLDSDPKSRDLYWRVYGGSPDGPAKFLSGPRVQLPEMLPVVVLMIAERIALLKEAEARGERFTWRDAPDNHALRRLRDEARERGRA